MIPRPPPPQSSTAADPHGGDPARLLITGPPGSGKTREVQQRVDAAIRTAGAGRVLLVLPTYGDVEHAKRTALFRVESSSEGEVRGLLDAPYATFTSLAERLYPAYHVRVLPSRVERDLLAGEALKVAAVPAFEAVRDRAGFRSRFLRLVKEMKQTGEAPEALRERARKAAAGMREAPRERLLGFLAAWEVYDRLLAEAGIPDHEDVLRRLLGTLKSDPPPMLRELNLLAIDGFEDLSGLESSLLDAATDAITAGGGHVVLTLPWDEARSELFLTTAPLKERLLAHRGFVERPLAGFVRSNAPPLAHLANNLFRADQGSPLPMDAGGDVLSIVGADPPDEIDRIGREILKLREATPPVAFREVGIVFRRLDGIGVPARRALERLGIPTRLVGAGARLASEPVVRALRGPLRLLAGRDGIDGRDFDPAPLLDYLRWRALASGAPIPAEIVDDLDIAWRKDGFPSDWREFQASVRAKGTGADAVAGDLEALRAGCDSARGAVQVWTAIERAIDALSQLPTPSGFDAEGRPTDSEGDEWLRRAGAARGRLLSLCRELKAAAERTRLFAEVRSADAVAMLLEAAAEATSEPPDRRLDAVHLLDAEEARHWELPVVFLAGLVEKEFPLHPREDVFLRDDDRAAFRARLAPPGGLEAPDLRTSSDAEIGERRLFLSAATRARRRLYLTRSAAGEDGREHAPSFFWKDVEHCLFATKPGGSRAALGAPPDDLGRVHVVPDEAVRSDDLLRFVTSRLGALPAEAPSDDVRLAVALARAGGQEARSVLERAARFRRFGAEDVGAHALPRLVASVMEVSPTQATTLISCRHRHHLRYVLDLPEDDVPFTGPSVDRRDMGKIVHDALRRAVLDSTASPEAVAAASIAESAAELPDSAERDWIARDLVRIVKLFRAREVLGARSGFLPSADVVERGFGAKEGLPVLLGEGDGAFALKGRFDRLDSHGAEGERLAIVVDYKLSKGSVETDFKELKASHNLQLPLYARAIERLHGVTVVGLELYAAFVRHRRLVFDERCEPALSLRREGGALVAKTSAEFRALLDDAERGAVEGVATVRHGGAAALARRPTDPEDCEQCPYRGVCRPDTGRFRAEVPS